MNKRDVVELESAFLDFCKIAQDLGYKFQYGSKIELQHASESTHSMNGRVNLDPNEYMKES